MTPKHKGLRIGKFDIAADFFDRVKHAKTEEEYENAKEPLFMLLKDMLVLEAEYVALENRFTYIAISDLFEPLEEGSIIPSYTITAEVLVDPKGNKQVDVKAEPYAVEVIYYSGVNVTKTEGNINN